MTEAEVRNRETYAATIAAIEDSVRQLNDAGPRDGQTDQIRIAWGYASREHEHLLTSNGSAYAGLLDCDGHAIRLLIYDAPQSPAVQLSLSLGPMLGKHGLFALPNTPEELYNLLLAIGTTGVHPIMRPWHHEGIEPCVLLSGLSLSLQGDIGPANIDRALATLIATAQGISGGFLDRDFSVGGLLDRWSEDVTRPE